MKKILVFSNLLFFIFSLNTIAQNPAVQNINIDKGESPFSNPVILAHYSVQELNQMQQSDSIKFKTIVYYYTQSFSVESVICSDCIQTDIAIIDISKFEYLRKKSYNYTKDFTKYGFKLTLIATDELEYKMPIHLPLTTPLDEDSE
ncbi:MAG: hypothetical protein IPH89_09490 [Bacteroidetes bacterium]|nr:hypothetical protein [Bacteroidota bacterium]